MRIMLSSLRNILLAANQPYWLNKVELCNTISRLPIIHIAFVEKCHRGEFNNKNTAESGDQENNQGNHYLLRVAIYYHFIIVLLTCNCLFSM